MYNRCEEEVNIMLDSSLQNLSLKEDFKIEQVHLRFIFVLLSPELRMQESVFMGIGNKRFMDIQPSDAAIKDRAINYVRMGRGKTLLLFSHFEDTFIQSDCH